MRAIIFPGKPSGCMVPPPSKSIAHRVLLAAGLAPGVSEIKGMTLSDDVLATIRVLRALGAQVHLQGGSATVTGADVFRRGGPIEAQCGESASTLRFAVPLLALSGRNITLTGMGRLLQRPMDPYKTIFENRGLSFDLTEDALHFKGPLTSGDYTVPGGISSHFFTGLLLALPLLPGISRIFSDGEIVSAGYVELTIKVQQAFGVRILRDVQHGCFLITGGQQYTCGKFTVPGDDSQAAFWAALGSICGNVQVSGYSEEYPQPDRAILGFLKKGGANFTREGDVLRFEKAPLHGFKANLTNCPDLGPVLMAAGLYCDSNVSLANTGRLAMKESDRAHAMAKELRKFGAKIRVGQNSVCVRPAELHEPTEPLCSHGDHRVVMALTLAAIAGGFSAEIEGAEAVKKSWPGFFDELNKAGANIRLVD